MKNVSDLYHDAHKSYYLCCKIVTPNYLGKFPGVLHTIEEEGTILYASLVKVEDPPLHLSLDDT